MDRQLLDVHTPGAPHSSAGGCTDVASSSGWTAILLAGERPGGDPLAAHLDVAFKALIRLGGHTMLEHVLAALLASPGIARVVVLAQRPDMLKIKTAAHLATDARVRFAASGNGIASSIAAVAGTDIAPWPILVTTADNVLLTAEMVEEFLVQAQSCDIGIGVGARSVVQTVYPDTRRTWMKFSDDDYSGANLFALAGDQVTAALSLWAGIEQDRKKFWRIVTRFGPALLLRALSRSIGFAEAIRRAGTRLGIDARLVLMRQPEAPIDVDSEADLALVRSILARRPAPLHGLY